MENNKNKILNVPTLRFKEFNEEWEQHLFKDVFIIKNGLNKEKEFFGKGIPIINYMDVNKNTNITLDIIKGLVDLSPSEVNIFKIEKGDILFTRTSETSEEIGLSASVIENLPNTVFSGFLLRARPNMEVFDEIYSGYYFRSPGLRKEIIKHSSITTRALTSGYLLNQLSIRVPSIDEQKKIGALFRGIDSRIKIQRKLIDSYKSLIMGLIDVEFSDTHNIFVPLGKSLIEVSNRNKLLQNLKVLSVSNTQGFINQTDQFDGRNIASENTSNYKIVSKGDFAYNPARINVGSISRLKHIERGIISPMYVCFKVVEASFYAEYFDWFLKSTRFRKELITKLEGSVRQVLSFNDLTTIKLAVQSKEQQMMFTRFLNAINFYNELNLKTLKKLIKLKTALASKMFI